MKEAEAPVRHKRIPDAWTSRGPDLAFDRIRDLRGVRGGRSGEPGKPLQVAGSEDRLRPLAGRVQLKAAPADRMVPDASVTTAARGKASVALELRLDLLPRSRTAADRPKARCFRLHIHLPGRRRVHPERINTLQETSAPPDPLELRGCLHWPDPAPEERPPYPQMEGGFPTPKPPGRDESRSAVSAHGVFGWRAITRSSRRFAFSNAVSASFDHGPILDGRQDGLAKAIFLSKCFAGLLRTKVGSVPVALPEL